jgi:hypothetical protein
VLTLAFCDVAEQNGEVFKLHEEKAGDPLFDAIVVSNCKNATNVVQRTRHVLMRLLGEFFPKNKNDAKGSRKVSRGLRHFGRPFNIAEEILD